MTTDTIKLSVRFFAILREIVGVSRISIPIKKGTSVLGTIEQLTVKFRDLKDYLYVNGMVNSQFIYIINGENISSLDDILNDNDELVILPPSGGG